MINYAFAEGRYENIAVVDSTGAEIHGGIALSSSLSLNANYAFIDATDGAGNPLIQVPRHSGDLSLDFDAGGAMSGRLLSESLELFARLENLLDEHYQQILGYGVPGRSGSVGARVRF